MSAAVGVEAIRDEDRRKKAVVYCARFLQDALQIQREYRTLGRHQTGCSFTRVKHWLSRRLCLWCGMFLGSLLSSIFSYFLYFATHFLNFRRTFSFREKIRKLSHCVIYYRKTPIPIQFLCSSHYDESVSGNELYMV